MSGFVTEISHGWYASSRVPGPDVDSVVLPDQIVSALETWEGVPTLMGIQHPTRRAAAISLAPEVLIASARTELEYLVLSHYREFRNGFILYRMSVAGHQAVGLFCMVDPLVANENHYRLHSTEAVFPEVVRERAAVIPDLDVCTSAITVIPATRTDELSPRLLALLQTTNAPDSTMLDDDGRRHEMWLVDASDVRKIVDDLNSSSLIVADGNHRVATAQLTGSPRLLCYVTAGQNLKIDPIHRILKDTTLQVHDIERACGELGWRVDESYASQPTLGTVSFHDGWRGLTVVLSDSASRSAYDLIENDLFKGCFGIDAENILPLPHFEEINSFYPMADMVVRFPHIANGILFDTFERRVQLPRKSASITPKPKSGVVFASIGGV